MTERWFTTPTTTEIAVRPEEFTGVERASLREIVDFAMKNNGTDWELMHCLDAAGNKVMATGTGLKGVPLTPEMKQAMKDGNVRFWHNHPSRGSISDADWTVLGSTEQTEILAVTLEGSFFVGRITKWPEEIEAVMGEKFRRLAGDIDTHLQSKMSGLGMIDARLQSQHLDGHLLNEALSAAGVVRYAALLSSSDEAHLAAAEEAGLGAMARTFVETAIRQDIANHVTSSTK